MIVQTCWPFLFIIFIGFCCCAPHYCSHWPGTHSNPFPTVCCLNKSAASQTVKKPSLCFLPSKSAVPLGFIDCSVWCERRITNTTSISVYSSIALLHCPSYHLDTSTVTLFLCFHPLSVNTILSWLLNKMLTSLHWNDCCPGQIAQPSVSQWLLPSIPCIIWTV